MAGTEDESEAFVLLEDAPPFYQALHTKYIAGLAKSMEGSFEGALTQHLRMSGVYWSVAALSLLLPPEQVDSRMNLNDDNDNDNDTTDSKESSIVEWVVSCFDESSGGYGAEVGHDGHLLYTLSAVQILAMADQLDKVPVQRVTKFVASLQQPDGSFIGDQWGEVDTRFTYCAVSTLSILQQLHNDDIIAPIDMDKAANYILQCRNLDGGFGAVIGAESHAGQVFCCIGALSILQRLDVLLLLLSPSSSGATTRLEWWLAERQCDSGGLNGRSEKQADVCYSWWIISALSILGRIPFISQKRLASFILKCQDPDDGGIADRPDDMPDVYHTFFGIAGLSLLGLLHNHSNHNQPTRRRIDPIYALPQDVVERLGLKAQVIQHDDDDDDEPLDPRLERYNVLRVP